MDKGSIHPSTDFRTKLIRPLGSRTLASRRIEQRPVSVEILSDCSLLICAIKLYNPISCHQFMDLDLGIRMVIWKSRSHESHLILPNSYAVFYVLTLMPTPERSHIQYPLYLTAPVYSSSTTPTLAFHIFSFNLTTPFQVLSSQFSPSALSDKYVLSFFSSPSGTGCWEASRRRGGGANCVGTFRGGRGGAEDRILGW